MRDDDLVEGCGGAEQKPGGDRVELGRLYDAEGRLLQLIEKGEVILESREYVTWAEARELGVLQPCPACGGGGKVVLLTSAKACDVCQGSGRARVYEVLYTRSVWDGDVLRESVDERWIYVGNRLIRKERIE